MITKQKTNNSGAKEAQGSLLSGLLIPVLVLIGWSNSGCLLHEDDDVELSTTTEQITWADHDYLFVTRAKTWTAAKATCARYDGGSGYHLVIINDEQEEAFLNTAEMARGISRWWIGLSDLAYEGRFAWVGGSLLNNGYANWRTGEPNNWNNTEDCVIDGALAGGIPSDYWNDADCTTAYSFICERDALPTGNKGSFFYSRASTNNATTNTFQWGVNLTAGMIFTVGTCGLPGASVTTGDTWLRIKNTSGVEVGSNNDSGGDCGTGSNVSVTVGATGTWWISAGCNGDSACSGTVAYSY